MRREALDLRTELKQARARTDALFALLCPDAVYERPIPERHRSVFYIGHLEAFDWNLLAEPLGLAAFDASLDKLFAFGIDPSAGDLPNDQPSDWPALPAVRQYVRTVRERLDAAFSRVPEYLLDVAIEHRLMHAETFGYMLHNLPHGMKIAQAVSVPDGAPPPAPAMLEIPAGEAPLGCTSGFGWDNEFRAHSVNVPAFAISKYKVTNGEYLEFVRAGAGAPHFWVRRDGEWYWRGMFGEVPLPLAWPVWVTQREAAAYAAWSGMSLPTEAQFQRAAYCDGIPETGNFDFRGWDPVSVDEAPNSLGVAQMIGNGWEWTDTVFAPFEGFTPFPFYRNYSEPFFDGQHYVMKGGSPLTAARLLRPSFRNWFRPAYPYVYAGFRLVRNR